MIGTRYRTDRMHVAHPSTLFIQAKTAITPSVAKSFRSVCSAPLFSLTNKQFAAGCDFIRLLPDKSFFLFSVVLFNQN